MAEERIVADTILILWPPAHRPCSPGIRRARCVIVAERSMEGHVEAYRAKLLFEPGRLPEDDGDTSLQPFLIAVPIGSRSGAAPRTKGSASILQSEEVVSDRLGLPIR
jgi:hypothetical protein